MASGFGAAQDISGVLAGFYNQYENQQASLANQSAQRASDARAAQDNDMIDQWQSGAIDDSQFLAYAQARANDASNDPGITAQWRKTVRNVQAAVKQHSVEDGARSIMDGIRNGTRSYADLMKFYQRQLSSLKRNDPLYESILGQIDQVKNQIATGSGGGSGGSRGGGGGSSAAGTTKFINAQIDAIQAAQDAIKQASDAYSKGQPVASITMVDANGALATRDIQVANPDGSPSTDMHALDLQMLDLYGALSKAHLAKGDHSAAIADQVARGKWVTDQIQPRNTVLPEQQANTLFSAGIEMVKAAANSPDPLGNWSQVQEWAKNVHTWQQHLNQYTKITPNKHTSQQLGQNPELVNVTQTRTETAKPAVDQTTAAFAGKAGALDALAAAIENADSTNVGALLDGVFGTSNDPAIDTTKSQLKSLLGVALSTVRGQADGTYRMVYTANEGYSWVPVKQTVVGQNPDGSPLYNAIPLNPANGKPLLDPQKGQQLTQVLADVNGTTMPVLAVSSPAQILNGQLITSTSGLSAADKQSVKTVNAVYLTDSQGQAHYWYQLDNGWYRDNVDPSKAKPMPAPFEGNNVRAAQAYATQLGIDPGGMAYFNASLVSPKGQQQLASETWYDKAQQDYQLQKAQQQRDQLHSSVAAPSSSPTDMASGVPPMLLRLAKELNIRTAEDIAAPPAPVLPTVVPKSKQTRLLFDTITPPTTTPTVDPIALALSANSASAASQATTTVQSGQYAGKKVPL